MTAEQFHQRIWEILEDLNSDYFQVVAAPAPEPQAIAASEALTGVPVPAYYSAFCQRTNGLCVMAREEFWPEAELYSVGPAWTFWRGVVLLGFDTPDLPEWASVTAACERLADYEVTGVLPLMKVVGDGNIIWGLDKSGTPVEVAEGEITRLPADFTACYEEQIRGLAERQSEMMERIAEQKRRTAE